MSEQDDKQAWRDLATETVRNLSALVEQAESLLRRAEKQLRELEDRDDE